MTNDELVEAIVAQLQSEAGAPPDPLIAEIGADMMRPVARHIVVSGVPYLIVEHGKAIMCLRCGAVSRNTNDVERRYCALCHVFHGDQETTVLPR